MINNIYVKVLVVVFVAAIVPYAVHAESSGTVRFAVFGHSYPIVKTETQRTVLIEAFNTEQLDAVFALGDADLDKEPVVDQYRTGLSSSFFPIPGNHEFKEGQTDAYLSSVGFLEATTTIGDVHMILLNSSASAEHNRDFLQEALAERSKEETVMILTHHRVCDDSIIDVRPYMHDKSYRFAEISESFDGKIDAIISGNSPGQYFGNQFGEVENDNIVYWTDLVDGIPCTNVGMGGTWGIDISRVSYVVVSIVDGKIHMEPRSFQLDPDEQVSGTAVSKGNNLQKWVTLIQKKLKTRTYWMGVGTGAATVGLLLGYWLIRNRKEV